MCGPGHWLPLVLLGDWVAGSPPPAPSRVVRYPSPRPATVAGGPAPWSTRCSESTCRQPAVDVEELDR
ncbi:hypothetical protein PVAP13_6NG054830 [Panicum virgatum]|uniref:Secreted protein n=1 Tax=Panicum virgatum TaxID=38727 RepID=A0A8T0QU36_PANVG|nr:hypothetical protein PVAP13_6NG054830 [Panicum virgatum]